MVSELITAIILSALPISEVRGGIPVAILSGVNPVVAVVVCTIANIAVIPLVFFFLEYVHAQLMRFGIYQATFDLVMERTRGKVESLVNKYGYLGLALFVAVPLPATGAYTGTLAAWFLGMKKRKAFLAIASGVVAASVIVTAVMLTGSKLFSVFVK
ncbi:MAG TPA: small multi-drug export protein [Candidatus Nanoarchaeia archaeon]|nr:small multi-drug export protein [Candidatus Nanoarchaeia archaeon]